ncbi:MAG: hypothetical protein AAGJ53_05600, partial [Pseudomonadota bacterium]
LAGKTFEVPAVDIAVTFNNADTVSLDGLDIAFARQKTVVVNRSHVTARGCRFASSGTSDAVDLSGDDGASWMHHDCIFEDAGDDGLNTNGAVRVTGFGGIYRGNRGDGLAPHGVGGVVRSFGEQFEGNFKQGFVAIGPGTFELRGAHATGNADVDILVLLDGVDADTRVSVHDCVSDLTHIASNSHGHRIAAEVTDHRGPLRLNCVATVDGLRARGPGDCLRVDGNSADVTDFHFANGQRGVLLSGGSLTLRQGQILRCGIGVLKSGGALLLDVDQPVNNHGSPEPFSGVSAADQALMVSIPAV